MFWRAWIAAEAKRIESSGPTPEAMMAFADSEESAAELALDDADERFDQCVMARL